MTVSLWQRGSSPRRVRADVAVIGAGICGLSAAAAFEARGMRVVVLEQHRAGAGASGRNAGYLMRGLAENYAVASRELGEDLARAAWRMSESNLDALRGLGIARLSSYREMPSVLAAMGADEAGQLEHAADLMQRDGFACRLMRRDDADASDAVWSHGRPLMGLVNPRDATVDPVELVGLLRDRLRSAMVVEQAEVFGVGPGDESPVCVRARGIDVDADRVFVATNAFAADLFPALEGLVVANRGQMLAMRCSSPVRLDAAYYLNGGSEYVRADIHGHLIVGGCRTIDGADERGKFDGVSAPVQDGLEAFAARLLGPVVEGAEVIARWGGPMGFSPDGLPLVGPLGVEGVEDGAVWFCGGFTGHGMSLGHVTAIDAVEAWLNGRTPVFERKVAGFGGGQDPSPSQAGTTVAR